ncbi:protein white [Nephila pilipes]|uniref:Protein white n=1 Tax=Nephila pilipes TaxID=299642 RepID=A0A8X6NW96_NEPPI|nr:protein white [Nephila pilipes]
MKVKLPLNSYHVLQSKRYKVPWISQFRTVFWRSCLSLRRDVVLLKVRLFQAAAMGLLIGLIFLQQDMDQKGVMNINGAIFLLLVNVSFNNMYTVINAFTVEEPVFRREHWNGMYRVDVYFLSKTISEAPILMLMTTILICIVYWMTGFRPDLMAFLICLVIFNLAAHTAASFGYMISCISTGLNVAPSIASPFILPFVIFGGFYLNIESVPKYFIWLKYLSMFYYGNEALLINQWVPIQNITCTSSHCMRDGKAVLASLDFNEDNLFPNIIAITVLMIVFRILAFIGLLVKSSRRT